MKKALFYGFLSAMFFSVTFILNRSMNLGGGYWVWTACLRYIISLPVLYALVCRGNGVEKVMGAIKAQPGKWVLWSTVGFGVFYLALSMASCYGESWFVAATWQLTIVTGVMMTPLFGRKIPMKNLMFSCVILVGIGLMQLDHLSGIGREGTLTAFVLILTAAIAYPLGNRKMMALCPEGMTTIQRVFGMTVCSMPVWIACAVYAGVTHGAPSGGQLVQSLTVAVVSGVIATLMFFDATNRVRKNPKQLAIIEATQSSEVIFTLIGGIALLGDAMPSAAGLVGVAVIVAGMIGNSFCQK